MGRGKRGSIQAGRGPGRGQGLIDENASLSPHSRVGEMNISLSVSHELPEGHHSQQSSDPIDSAAGLESQGAAPTASSSTSVKRVRGLNKCNKLNKMVAKHGPITLDIPARHRTPVGENASMFATNNWSLICDSYDCDEWKKKSKRNAENRSMCGMNHMASTRSFVNKIHKRKREIGSTPSSVAFYKDTHTKKDGTFVNSICENLHNKMIALTDRGDVVREQEVVTQVLGGPRSFYIRGMGCGLIPTPSSSSKGNSSAWSKKKEFLINELQETKSQLEDLNAKIAKLEEKQEKMEKTMEMILSRLGRFGWSLIGGESSQGNN